MSNETGIDSDNRPEQPQFDPVRLKQQAANELGLAAFGDDPFQEFYERYIDALNRGGVMTPQGVRRAESQVLRALRNRLELRDWRAREPSIAQEVIDRPILLMGLPRSGTTIMHHLFDHDPNMRLLRMWETVQPCPPPAVDPKSAETRLEFARQMKAEALKQKKDFDALHLLDPDGPDECTNLLDQVFAMVGVENLFKVPGYFQWLADAADFRKVYEHHKSILQLLQWQAPRKRWVLKYPNYVMSMTELSATYPDALFVVSHRDPVQALASLCKLTHTLRAVCYDEKDNDKHRVGQDIWHYVQTHVDHLLEFRRSNNPVSIIDIDYQKLVDSPVEVVESVYAATGMEFPDSVRRELAEWTKNNPKGKRGVNTYQLEDYGLDRDRVEVGFKAYREAFNIPRENG